MLDLFAHPNARVFNTQIEYYENLPHSTSKRNKEYLNLYLLILALIPFLSFLGI